MTDSRTCTIEDCIKERGRKDPTYCTMHRARVYRHGSPYVVKKTGCPSGPANPGWKSGAVGYGATHDRLRSVYGSARDYACVDCDGPARHWSYDHVAAEVVASLGLAEEFRVITDMGVAAIKSAEQAKYLTDHHRDMTAQARYVTAWTEEDH